MQMVALLARGKTDAEVAAMMNIKENSIGPRICAINTSIGTRTREEVIAYYHQYQDIYRKHRQRRSAVLLHWLLNPPPKSRHGWSLPVQWKRVIGRGKRFYNGGPYIPESTFKSLQDYKQKVLQLKMNGVDDKIIAEKYKLKETTVRSYMSDMKAHARWVSGVTVSDEALIAAYKKYLKRNKQLMNQNSKAR
jgi:DNA-binding CsgD family transcriptional regulator